ncbi:MAG: winged helix-turn-helix domain-containing protein [Anderseniella sp.]|jgi:TolB-like protein/Flp pilus assembly protein TadD|nr:winged helix-turn-helix domain-containing protein [Anderseniella sp.]
MRYSFGDFTIDLSRYELSANGQPLPLEPQVFDVLHHLVENRHKVVSTQELLDAVWNGRIVSDAAISSRIRDVRRVLNDDGAAQRWVRTVRGRGFRFVGDVEETSDGRTGALEQGVFSGDLSEQSEQIATEVLSRPAIAVLPFVNGSQTAGSAYLADGLTDEIIAALCSWRWFPVIARNTSYRFRGSDLSAAEIGRTCGARYLLQGAMRNDHKRVKVTVELIDADEDVVIWTTRITTALDELLTLEEEIASQVVAMLEPEIRGAEMRRVLRKTAGDFGAWELTMRARWLAQNGDYDAAEQMAAEAAEREPDWYLPHTLIAQFRFQKAMTGFSNADSRTAFSGTLAAARQALAIDGGAWLAHALTGVGELWTNRNHDLALEHVSRAIELNPSASQAYHFGGCIAGFSGEPGVARHQQLRIGRLDPAYPYAAVIEADLGLWHLLDGNYEAAENHMVKAESLDPRYPRALQRRIALSGLQGNRSEAQRAEKKLRSLGTPLDAEALTLSYPFRKEEHRLIFLDGLRKAGVNI